MLNYRNHFREQKPTDTESVSSSKKRNLTYPDLSFLNKKKSVYREHNHIYFRTDVTSESVGELCNLIVEYNREQDYIRSECTTSIVISKPIYLHIMSYGGDLMAGFMAYDYIKQSKIPIYTIAEGYTVSAGSVMFMAGKKRLITENSYFLVHQLSSCNYSTSTFHNMIDDTINNIEFMTRLYKLYLQNIRYKKGSVHKNHLTKKKLENHMLHDIYWNAETCIKYGLADDVYSNYQTFDMIDIKEVSKNLQDENYVYYSHKYSEKDFKPSQQVINRINENIKNSVNVVDMMKTFISKKTQQNPNSIVNNDLFDNINDSDLEDTDNEELEELEQPKRKKRKKTPKKQKLPSKMKTRSSNK
jgi:ATP-dependent protease ClpP protease subunit